MDSGPIIPALFWRPAWCGRHPAFRAETDPPLMIDRLHSYRVRSSSDSRQDSAPGHIVRTNRMRTTGPSHARVPQAVHRYRSCARAGRGLTKVQHIQLYVSYLMWLAAQPLSMGCIVKEFILISRSSRRTAGSVRARNFTNSSHERSTDLECLTFSKDPLE